MTTIHGIDPAGDLWVERDGDLTAFAPPALRTMLRDLRSEQSTGSVRVAGHDWDESTVLAMVRAFIDGPELDLCRECDAVPVLERLDSRCGPCGVAHDEGSDRISAIGRAS